MIQHNNRKHQSKFRRLLRIVKRLMYVCITGAAVYFIITGVKFWITHSEVFRVTQVEVTGANILSVEDIRSLITLEQDQRIFDMDMKPLKKKIEANPYIAHVSVGRKFPGTISIDLNERTPFAYISLNKVYFVDAGGYLLPTRWEIPENLNGIKKYADLPIITGISVKNPKIGAKTTDMRLTKALSFLQLLSSEFSEYMDTISELHCNPDGSFSLFLSENGVRVEFGTGDYRNKLVKLHYFLAYYEERNQENKLQYINLKYRDQIVVKEVN